MVFDCDIKALHLSTFKCIFIHVILQYIYIVPDVIRVKLYLNGDFLLHSYGWFIILFNTFAIVISLCLGSVGVYTQSGPYSSW